MFHRDDASFWTNYSPVPHPAEIARMRELFPDAARAQALLDFGLRPFGLMDEDVYGQPEGMGGPWAPAPGDLSEKPLLVDLQTGWRFRAAEDALQLDVQLSDNFMGTQILLARASAHGADFDFNFDVQRRPACHPMSDQNSFPLTQPLELCADDEASLRSHLDRLQGLFCGRVGVKRLWLRGQRQEYTLARSPDLTELLYTTSRQASLVPSLGRYAMNHPEKMRFGFAWAGPNHRWKKPFITWMARANRHWFEHEPRCLEVLTEVLRDGDDNKFRALLAQIQMSPLEVGNPPFLNWPDEVDDLRQSFFVLMKRFEFAVTLQQYGYVTSLLDVTTDLDTALYFSQASMIDGRMRVQAPRPGRVIYVLAESRRDNFFFHGKDLFWGSDGWVCTQPPRLERQSAGFIAGSTSRTQNFYSSMIVAKIWLGDESPTTRLSDEMLFPSLEDDLLFATLRESRPELEGLY